MLYSSFAFGQRGVSSGSMAMSRANGNYSVNETGHQPVRRIIVEDFLNYHLHDIDIPVKENAALSQQWLKLPNGNYLMQIGLATLEELPANQKQQPLNISIVIDKSGSMSGNNKLEKVKQALNVFVNRLPDGTQLSIVEFDSRANMVMKNTVLTANRRSVQDKIAAIHTGGNTNINEGLQFGLEEISKVHKTNTHSRVILLTDGMTNAGETNPDAILSNAGEYFSSGIEVTTIGVGMSLDFDLLRNLAEKGKGSNHFIGDEEKDIQKVFIDEINALTQHLGKNVELKMQLPKGVRLVHSYGYSFEYDTVKNTLSIPTENLNAKRTQVFLLELEGSGWNQLQTALYYADIEGKKQVLEMKTSGSDLKQQKDIERNYFIAQIAQLLKDTSDFSAVKNKIEDIEKQIKASQWSKDTAIKEVLEIAKKFV